MFQSDTIYVILILVGYGLAAYYFAVARSHRIWIDKLDERNAALRAELKDWQNKALNVYGRTPLGHETRPKPPKSETVTTAPTVVHRGELEARYAQTEPKTPPQTTIFANYQQVARSQFSAEELIEKARAIKDQSEENDR